MMKAKMISAEPFGVKQEKIHQQIFKATTENCGTVLIVEDETELAEVLEFNLLQQGYDVLLAVDGLEACRVIGREKPDLILLDLMLPLLDGWEICRMVRSHHDQQVAKTPIIILSALGSADDRIKGYDLGADLYLPKPYTIKELIIKTQPLISQHREYLQLTDSLSSLQKMSELQDQWQQVLFHELRNQLTFISGIAEHLHNSTADLGQEKADHFTGQIIDSSHYLETLADNYLLIRNMENNPEPLQCEKIVLYDLLSEMSQLFQPQAIQKACDIEIICPTDLILNLHPIGIKIILSRILDNALKHSNLDGNIIVTVEKMTSQVQIQIQDDGDGINGDERDKVFDKFYRGNATAKKQTGAGLGLYMARSLAEAMNGSLQLIDNQLPGSCFQLQLLA